MIGGVVVVTDGRVAEPGRAMVAVVLGTALARRLPLRRSPAPTARAWSYSPSSSALACQLNARSANPRAARPRRSRRRCPQAAAWSRLCDLEGVAAVEQHALPAVGDEAAEVRGREKDGPAAGKELRELRGEAIVVEAAWLDENVGKAQVPRDLAARLQRHRDDVLLDGSQLRLEEADEVPPQPDEPDRPPGPVERRDGQVETAHLSRVRGVHVPRVHDHRLSVRDPRAAAGAPARPARR